MNFVAKKIHKDAVTKAQSWTDEDKAIVQAIVKNQDIEGFGNYVSIASSTRIDFERDKFGESLLQEMAKQYEEGRTVVFMHNASMGIGRTYAAKVVDGQNGDKELEVKFYINPNAQLPTGNAKELIDTGVYSRLSVSVFARPTDYIEADKSPDGKPFYSFQSGEGAAVKELSLVDMGMNADAQILKGYGQKSTSDAPPTFPENQKDAMELTKYKIKSFDDKSIELPDSAIEVVKSLDSEVRDLREKVKGFEDKAKEDLQKLEKVYQAKALQLIKDPTEKHKKQLEMEAKAFSSNPDLLKIKIDALEKQIAKAKSNQLTPKVKPKSASETEKDIPLFANTQ